MTEQEVDEMFNGLECLMEKQGDSNSRLVLPVLPRAQTGGLLSLSGIQTSSRPNKMGCLKGDHFSQGT